MSLDLLKYSIRTSFANEVIKLFFNFFDEVEIFKIVLQVS